MQVAMQRIGAKKELSSLQSTIGDKLGWMTQQIWVPSKKTDEFIWRQGTSEGFGIPVQIGKFDEQMSASLSSQIDSITRQFNAINEMTDVVPGLLVPMFLLACRHHRLPLPPHLWFHMNTVEV